jgi:sulfate permease, SulP family
MSGRFAPALRDSLHRYGWKAFRSDLGAGLTVGIIALPLSLALAVASGVSPEHGLYTVVVGAMIAALLGGSRVNISGPTAAFVVILLPVVHKFGLSGLFAAGMLAGFLQILMGVFQTGRLIHLVPYPVVVGFTSGIGLVIALLQTKGFLGLNYPEASDLTLLKALDLLRHLPGTSFWSLGVGLATILILTQWKRTRIPIPPHIPAVLVATGLSLWFNGQFQAGIDTIGSRFTYLMPGGITGHGIPPYLPSFQPSQILAMLTNMSTLQALLPPAFTIAMLGALESLLCAVVADRMTGKHHHPNGELIGQGIANVITPFFGGIPVTAAIARTAANVNAGGRTVFASVLHCIFVLLTIVILGKALGYLPLPALSGLLLVTAWKMSEARHFWEIAKRANKSDTTVLLACFGLTVAFDMVVSVVVGLGLSAALFIASTIKHTHLRHEVDADGVLTIFFEGSLFFGVANHLTEGARKLARGHDQIYLDFSGMRSIDYSGLESLSNSILEWRQNGKMVILRKASDEIKEALLRHIRE